MKFFPYLCFRGQGTHCTTWSNWATMFGWPWKSRSTSGSGGTDDFVLWIFTDFFSIYVFKVKWIHCRHSQWAATVWVTSKQSRSTVRYRRYSKVLMIVSYRFLKFFPYLCFRGQGTHCRHFYWATMFGWPWKSRSTSGSGAYWCHYDVIVNFHQFLQYWCFWGQGMSMPTFLLIYHVGVTSKIQVTSGTGGTWRYWWFCLMDFPNFFSIYVFEVKEFIADIPTELLMFEWPWKSVGQLPVTN